MSEASVNFDELSASVARFNNSLSRLETSLAGAVNTVAELARNTGFEDGKAAAFQSLEEGREDLILREELMASKSREAALEDAIKEAKLALTETIDEIKNVIGSV